MQGKLVESKIVEITREHLDTLYIKYNKKSLVSPDPLQFLYNYDNKTDIEVVGVIASTLAYGRVAQILKSVSMVLEKMGKSPSDFLLKSSIDHISDSFKGFKHRFTDCDDITGLMLGMRGILERFPSMEDCFIKGLNINDSNVLGALSRFRNSLILNGNNLKCSMLPDPLMGSACKRLNLFLRWMVRNDDVDLGVWTKVSPSKLIIPLDIHMYKIAVLLNFTKRKSADLKTAIEITEEFREINCEDPVKYDFALTRFGIRDDMFMKDLVDIISVPVIVSNIKNKV